MKPMNDKIEPEGLVPSLLVFGVVPSLTVISNSLPQQREQMAALALEWAEWPQ